MQAGDTEGSRSQMEQEVPAPPERELSVLRELAREGEAIVGFQGLKRELALHQQQLSRTLKRLVEDGLVDQAEAGYHLTEVGFQVLAEQGAAIAARCGDAPLAQALLPPEVTAEQVADHLEGRWFQGLHWYGRAGGFDELTLVWTLTADEGARVRLRIQGNLFSVTVDCCREPSRATYQAVHALVTAVTELYGMEPERAEHADGPRAMTHGPRQAS